MRALEQRLARLEQAPSAGRSLYAWAETGETAEQAITRQFPGGLAHNATVTVYSWAGDHMPVVAGQGLVVNTSLTRRLAALEQAVGARRMVFRVYGTDADAEADSDLPEGVTVLRIITGVQRSPAVTPARP